MKIDILTLFPEMFAGPFEESIIKRAQEKGLVTINIHNLRHWAHDRHKTVDDRPFGGGTGMILMVEPIYKSLKDLKTKKQKNIKTKVILLDPTGTPFTQEKARELSKLDHLILIAGHYEGVDERVREHLVDEAISIGDYVLTGGELPAMVVVDAVVRLIPKVLEKSEAVKNESFSPPPSSPLDSTSLDKTRDKRGKPLDSQPTTHPHPFLEYPQYTRPAVYRGWKVPEVLLSGDHKKIEEWRQEKSLARTKKRRPDLLRG